MKPYGGGGDGLVPGFLNTGRAELGTSRPNPFHEYALSGACGGPGIICVDLARQSVIFP